LCIGEYGDHLLHRIEKDVSPLLPIIQTWARVKYPMPGTSRDSTGPKTININWVGNDDYLIAGKFIFDLDLLRG